MGVLQFGWLGVNTYFSSLALASVIPVPASIIMVIWGVLAAFVGLKGIQYVARVSTYLPLIPLAILLLLLGQDHRQRGQLLPVRRHRRRRGRPRRAARHRSACWPRC